MPDVLVINADLGPLHRVSLKHAIRMLIRQVAEIHEHEAGRPIGIFPRPTVVRLITYVVTRWRRGRGPAWSRAAVLRRDNQTCGYCPRRATTIDHIVPRSRGGGNDWLNTVAACARCNHRKADQTPAEAGMVLRRPPWAPGWDWLAV